MNTAELMSHVNRATQLYSSHIEMLESIGVDSDTISDSVIAAVRNRHGVLAGNPPSPILGYVFEVLIPDDEVAFYDLEEVRDATYMDVEYGAGNNDSFLLLYRINGLIEWSDSKYGLVLFDSAEQYTDRITEILDTPKALYGVGRQLYRAEECTLTEVLERRGEFS